MRLLPPIAATLLLAACYGERGMTWEEAADAGYAFDAGQSPRVDDPGPASLDGGADKADADTVTGAPDAHANATAVQRADHSAAAMDAEDANGRHNTTNEATPDVREPPGCPYEPGLCVGSDYYYCEEGSAVPLVLSCALTGPCKRATCENGVGCVDRSTDGDSCGDGDACTVGDKCGDGECRPGSKRLKCDDGDPCTVDGCLPETGCSSKPDDDLPCDDGLACTEGDRCAGGKCVFETNSCDCLDDIDCAPLDDGDPCNGVLRCDVNRCVVDEQTVPYCSYLWPGVCQRAFCDSTDGECKLAPAAEGQPCDDLEPCTERDECMSGFCVGRLGVSCQDGNPCTLDFCTAGVGCGHSHYEGSCEDGNACTLADVCVDGVCVPGSGTDTCDDWNPCTRDYCSPGEGCVQENLDVACDDGDGCTVDDWCVDGACTATPRECSHGECEAGVCAGAPYPPPPYGKLPGETFANHTFVDPEDESEVQMAEWFERGKILLITFNAGWCIVCRRDTSLLNGWMDVYGPDGLEILSILYETTSQDPITPSFALWWKRGYDVRFPLLMDTTHAGPDGTAEGGVLAGYTEPEGHLPDGTFPVTVLLCTADMRILHIDVGFRDEEEIFPLVRHYLYEEDCSAH
jgi:hypothetical protein